MLQQNTQLPGPVLNRLVDVPVRAWFAALALGLVGLLGAAMALQQIARIAPCPLCIAQRVFYILMILPALGGVIWPCGQRLWAAGIALCAALGGGVAAYQTWMQAFPHLAPECSYTDPNLLERLVDWLGMQWPSLFLATGFCGSRDWTFLNLSLANWSLLVFAAILILAVALIRRRV